MKSRISDKTRFAKGRGKGEREKYIPFLKTRDFSSIGRAHRPKGMLINRTYELFSDIEYHFFLLLDFATNIHDIREQFPLDLEETMEIAESHNIVHSPLDSEEKFVMTTDFLLTMKDGSSIALSIKPSSELIKKRVLEKLHVEYSYWKRKSVTWILLTEKEIDLIILKNIKNFQEKYFHEFENVDEFIYQLETHDWDSNTSIQEILRDVSKKCKIPFGKGREIFTYLLAHKKIVFDYTKHFSIDNPIHQFKLNSL